MAVDLTQVATPGFFATMAAALAQSFLAVL